MMHRVLLLVSYKRFDQTVQGGDMFDRIFFLLVGCVDVIAEIRHTKVAARRRNAPKNRQSRSSEYPAISAGFLYLKVQRLIIFLFVLIDRAVSANRGAVIIE